MGKKARRKKVVVEKGNQLNLILKLCFIVSLFVAPLFKGLFFEKHFMLTAIVLMSIAITYIVYNIDHIKFDIYDTMLLLFCFSYAISISNTADIRTSTVELMKQIVYFFCFYLARNMFANEQSREKLVDSIIVAISVVSLMTILSKGGIIEYPNLIAGARFAGTFTYANTYAAILAAVCVYIFAQLDLAERPNITAIRKYLYIFALCLNNIALYATMSRGGVLVYGFAVILVVLLTKSKIHNIVNISVVNVIALASAFAIQKSDDSLVLVVILSGALLAFGYFKVVRKMKWKSVLCVFGVPFVAALVALIINIDKTPFARLKDLNFSSHSFFARNMFYMDSLKIFKMHPIIGNGGGAWDFLYRRIQTAPYNTSLPHSSLFKTLVEVGALGALILVVIISITAYLYLARKRKREVTTIETGIFVAFIVLLAHSLIDFDFSIPYITIVFFMLMGLLLGKSKQWKVQKGLKIVVATLCFVTLIGSSCISIARGMTSKAFEATDNGNVTLSYYEEYLGVFKKAIKLDPLNSKYINHVGQTVIERGIIEGNKEMIDEGRGYLDKAVKVAPNEYSNYNVLGLKLYKMGKYEEAVQSYEKEIYLMPFIPIGYEDTIKTYVKWSMETQNTKYAQKAYEVYERAVEKIESVPQEYMKSVSVREYAYNSPVVSYQAGVAAYLLGNYETGVERLKNAQRYATNASFKEEMEAWIVVGYEKANLIVPSELKINEEKVNKVKKLLEEFKKIE